MEKGDYNCFSFIFSSEILTGQEVSLVAGQSPERHKRTNIFDGIMRDELHKHVYHHQNSGTYLNNQSVRDYLKSGINAAAGHASHGQLLLFLEIYQHSNVSNTQKISFLDYSAGLDIFVLLTFSESIRLFTGL